MPEVKYAERPDLFWRDLLLGGKGAENFLEQMDCAPSISRPNTIDNLMHGFKIIVNLVGLHLHFFKIQ